MPRFLIFEERGYKVETLIDAEDEEAAQQFDGTIVNEWQSESWAERLISSKQVEDDFESRTDL